MILGAPATPTRTATTRRQRARTHTRTAQEHSLLPNRLRDIFNIAFVQTDPIPNSNITRPVAYTDDAVSRTDKHTQNHAHP